MAEGRKAVFLLLLCLLVCCAGGCQRDRKSAGESVSKVCKTSIFSWEEEYLLPDMEDEIKKAVETLECGAVYQQIPSDTDMDVIKDYLKGVRNPARMSIIWQEIPGGRFRRTQRQCFRLLRQ